MSTRIDRGAKSREDILNAAAAAIALHGYFGMSMRELARTTGKGLSTFYSHFKSKEDVLFELQHNAFETLNHTATQAVASSPAPVTQLLLFIANHVHYVAQHGDVMRVLIHEASALPARRRAKVRALKERYFATAREVLRGIHAEGCDRPGTGAMGAAIDELELERTTYNLFGMLNWMYGWYDGERHGSVAEVTRSIHKLVLCGWVARCPERRALEDAERLVALARRPSPLAVLQPGDLHS